MVASSNCGFERFRLKRKRARKHLCFGVFRSEVPSLEEALRVSPAVLPLPSWAF